ncbi:MAG: LAGLIDADG family homing endonuclease [Candidatus Heimdallarchaeota archaeon]
MEKGVIPLPMLRGDEELWQQLTEQVLKEQKIIIQSAKGERSIIPLEITEKLVYLLGIIDGDGHLAKHQVHIVDYSKKQIEQLRQFFKDLFGVTGNIVEGKDGNYYILLVNCKWIVHLVSFITGHPLGRKYESLREPLILKTEPWNLFRGAYWRGMFDADGSYKGGIEFVTISEKLSCNLKNYLEEKAIKFTFKANNRGYRIYVQAGSRTEFKKQVGSWHPEKKSQLQTLLSRRYNGEEVTFLGINKQNLNSKGLFDFALMDNKISIIDSGTAMKQIREQKGFTRNDFAKFLAVNYSTLASYENSRSTPPIKTMIMVAAILEEPFSEFLQKYQLNKFTYILSVELPLRPSEELCDFMSYLYPRSHNVISLQTREQETLQRIEDYFSIKLENVRGNDFKNYVLWDFLQLFGLYKTMK